VEPEPEYGLNSPSPSVSPEPVSRAIFDHGRKFIPKTVTMDLDDNGMPTPTPSPEAKSDLNESDQSETYESSMQSFSSEDPSAR
jgi:hypothetical protein